MIWNWKRALALLFALVLALSLAAPALAEESDPAPEGTPAGDADEPAPGDGGEPAPGDGENGETPPEDPAGEEPEEPAEEPGQDGKEAEEIRIFVSAFGDDENGDGSETAPFETLARAAEAANAAAESKVVILLATDLDSKAVARFIGRDVTLKALEGQVTVTREEDFRPAMDAAGVLYNPPLIELRAPEGSELPAGTLTLIGVILDDALRCRVTGPEQPAETTEQPAETTEEPAETAEEPAETAEEPAKTTEEPAETAEEPAETAEEPAKTTEEPAETAEEPAEEPAETAETSAPAGETAAADRTEPVQEAIVTVGKGGTLILGVGAELRNFGGRCAVSLGEESCLRMEAGSAIRDTMQTQDLRPAILCPPNVKIELADGAVILERTRKEPESAGINAPGQEVGKIKSGSLAGTESVTRQTGDGTQTYPLEYHLSVSLNSKAQTDIKKFSGGIIGGGGTVTVSLDPRLTAGPTDCRIDNDIFEQDGEPVFDAQAHTLTLTFKLKADWAEHLDALSQPLVFSFGAALPDENFAPGTADQEEFLESTAALTMQFNKTASSYGPYDTSSLPALKCRTRMLDVPSALLRYDVNGGVTGSGPAEEALSAQPSYPLASSPVPGHDPADGVPVLFLGWTAEKDEHLYASGEERPATLSAIRVEEGSTNTVYAAYGLDLNEDGVPDVDQILWTLSFDANGGEGAPEDIIFVLDADTQELTAAVPQGEPAWEYHTFLGWSKDPNANGESGLIRSDAEDPLLREVTFTGDTTLYAVWMENYKIVYNANGGEDAPEPTVLQSMTLKTDPKTGEQYYAGRERITSEVPTRTGYTFQGWSPTRRGAAQFQANQLVEVADGDVTLYAVWTRGASGGTNGPKTGDRDLSGYAALLAASTVCLGLTVCLLRKKRQEEA